MKKYLLVIAGPTASGKTPLSIEVARHFNSHIISADARQFYLEMNAGTAKPSIEHLSQVPHHFINHLSIHDNYSAGDYEHEVVPFLDSLFRTQHLAMMIGGSGLFIKAVLEGFDLFPPADEEIFNKLKKLFFEEGIEPLQKLLAQHDPVYFEKVDRSNPQRLIRALTVCLSSGKPYSSFRKQKAKPRDFIPIKIGLQIEKEELHHRIDQRVEEMMEKGLIEEARKLFPFQHLNALRTVGYSELFDFLSEKISMEEAVKQIKLNTHHYAKRQMTWFKKEKEMNWFTPEQTSEIIRFIEGKMK